MIKMNWEQYRKHKQKIKYSVGGGDAAILMGYGWTPIFTRFLEKLGDIEKPEGTEAMEIGLEIEETIDKIFQKRTGIETRKPADIWVSEEYPYIVGAVDRVSDKHVIEYKNTSEYMKDKWDDGYPMSAYYQLQLYLWLDGNNRTGYIAGLIGGNKFTVSDEIQPDESAQADIIIKAQEFYQNLLDRNYEAIEITDKDSDAIKQKYDKQVEDDILFPKEELLEKERVMAEQISELKKERKKVKNKIRWVMMDFSNAHTDNYKLSNKIQTSNRFDSKKFKKEQPDLYKKYLKENKYKVLRVKKIKDKLDKK
ncbi:MAG: YqaJ viral recombinase family protein [Candidatus Cloacimonetes bacterium]|nr:YqaJ viral recombinase family protein [Candidatus Cloacimonadota bacterium]